MEDSTDVNTNLISEAMANANLSKTFIEEQLAGAQTVYEVLIDENKDEGNTIEMVDKNDFLKLQKAMNAQFSRFEEKLKETLVAMDQALQPVKELATRYNKL